MRYEQFTSTAATKETSFPTQSALDEVYAYLKQSRPKYAPLTNTVKADAPKVGDKIVSASPTNEKLSAAWKDASSSKQRCHQRHGQGSRKTSSVITWKGTGLQ
jgi:hypothetical protein